MYHVLDDLPVQIPLKEVYRYMGYPEEYQDIPANIIAMVKEEVSSACNLLLPKATYLTCDYNPATGNISSPCCNMKVSGTTIQSHLAACVKVTLFTCTIGTAIEPKIDDYFKSGEYTRAIILDAVGSATAESTADMLNQYIENAAYCQKHHLVSRFSPGYGDWDLSAQQELVAAAGGQSIGIQVTEASLLIPRKSVSGLIGWVPGLDSTRGMPAQSPCDTCLLPRCNNPICKGGSFR